MNASTDCREFTNGRYRVLINPAGGGQSCFEWMALTRWLGDAVENAHGFFIYLRDLDSGELWSAALQPTMARPDIYEATESPDSFTIRRMDHQISCETTVVVHPQDDLETRCVRVRNCSGRDRRLELTSYVEVALAHPQGDLSHMAFSKLFLQTDLFSPYGALLAKRRPRSQGESWPVLFHAMSGAVPENWETDRALFIGRGKAVASATMEMAGTVGSVLDPVFSLRTTICLAPGEERELCFILGATREPAALGAILDRHQVPIQHPAVDSRDRKAGRRTGADFSKLGAFSNDGSEYILRLPWNGSGLDLPPMPWCNVLANDRFGCLVSEKGAGTTWSRNSQANRLTPWSNDPLSDPHGEAVYLRDDETGKFSSPLPGPCPAPVDYETVHGFGYTKFHSIAEEIAREVVVFVAESDPLKVVRVRLTNRGQRPRRLSLYSYQRLVLGSMPPSPGAIRTWTQADVLCADNLQAGDFAGGVVFATFVASMPVRHFYECARRSFIGVNGSVVAPTALHSQRLGGQSGEGLDPCFACQVEFCLAPGDMAEVSFLLGEVMGADALASLLSRYGSSSAIDAELSNVKSFWKQRLGGIQVHCPVKAINQMVNGWLPYQALACRIWGRTAFYQSSGALGFRDQLQDAGNLSVLWPEVARAQILLHARHQFEEGDVLHWWHEAPMNKGVRTRFSDDLLWLPFVTMQYLQSSGDSGILDEMAPFLCAPELAAEEEERYFQPNVSVEAASVFEHCCRALDRALRFGVHGLPLMGTGDWNDGMNRVGREGRGESVWLGFFLYQLLGDFMTLAERRGDTARGVRYMNHREQLVGALNAAGWDGEWYRRAYYDDGTPLGTKESEECRIDGLAQAWSVLSGAAPAERGLQAMRSAANLLVDEENGLIRLLTPPFASTEEDPGYIKGYLPGVRENGGQYTHAACWMIAAAAKLGWHQEAAAWLERISPQWHCRNGAAVDRYKVEPYVIAADIYGAEPHVGRGGWTWYTGSAGWAYRVALESVLGLRIEDGSVLVVNPCVPNDWPEYTMRYRHPIFRTCYHVTVRNPNGCSAAVVSAVLDGNEVLVSGGQVKVAICQSGGAHELVVTLGKGS